MSAKSIRELRAYWVPQLRQLREARERTVRLIEALLFIFTLLAVALIIYVFVDWSFTSGVNYLLGAPLLFSFGCLILAVGYLSRIQGCNDALVKVECFVHLGDADGLINSLSEINCLTNLREIIDDFKRIIPTEKSTPGVIQNLS